MCVCAPCGASVYIIDARFSNAFDGSDGFLFFLSFDCLFDRCDMYSALFFILSIFGYSPCAIKLLLV